MAAAGYSSTEGKGEQLRRLVRQLVERQAESRTLDYKAAMGFGRSKAEKAEILKDIIAMSNVRDGGYLLIGVDENDGLYIPSSVTPEQVASFDPTKIGDFARQYCSILPIVTSNVVDLDGISLLLLTVAEFVDEPIVCIKDLHNNGNAILRAGSIYVRTVDARSVAIDSSETMRALLDLAVQKRGESLISQIQRLVGGSPSPVPVAPTDLELYGTELSGLEQFFLENDIGQPAWFFELLPLPYKEQRTQTQGRLQEIVRDSEVSIRGWNFPHTDRENHHPFEHGRESTTHWGRYHEGFRIYRSGLFGWRQELREIRSNQYDDGVSFVSAMYTIAEFLIFADRYMALLPGVDRVSMRFGIDGLRGRQLYADANVDLWDVHGSSVDRFVWQMEVLVTDLRAHGSEFAAEAAQRLFELFDVEISLEVITEWQTKFRERRF